jgi:hypothetical protein
VRHWYIETLFFSLKGGTITREIDMTTYTIIVRLNEKADCATIAFHGVKAKDIAEITAFANAAIRQLGVLNETVKIDCNPDKN